MENQTPTIIQPKIISVNTFYWEPGHDSRTRSFNEKRRLTEVSNYLKALGLNVNGSRNCVNANGIDAKGQAIKVSFYYYESCKNVYKTLK